MGFFKSVGNKLKRVVSVKNLVNGVTGNFSAIAQDAKRVMTTEDPKKSKNAPNNSLTNKAFEIPKEVQQMVETQEKKYIDNVTKSVAENPTVQKTSDFFTKLWFETQWRLHKTKILVALALLCGFLVYWFRFRKRKSRRR